MAQDRIKNSENKRQCSDSFKGRMKKDKTFQSKVIIRRLPPTMTEEQFLHQISPVPDHDYFYFVKADMRLGQHAVSRAYLNFTKQEDIFLFKDTFDGYVFLDTKGNEYPAIVEFSPFQKIPKKRSRKRDAKSGSIETDPDYVAFLESLKNPEEVSLPPAETYLEEIESREKELRANNGVLKCTTPLIEYLKQRKIEQQIREEKREERKRKELEKKRIREEERRRRKAEKDRVKEKESLSEKEIAEDAEETALSEDTKQSDPVVQVLKNPEREKEVKDNDPVQPKKSYLVWSMKDRGIRKDWEIDRNRDKNKPKDRSKVNERVVIPRDKDRNRRDRIEYKSYSSYRARRVENSFKSEETVSNDKSSKKSVTLPEAGSHEVKDKSTQKAKADARSSDTSDDIRQEVTASISQDGGEDCEKGKTCSEGLTEIVKGDCFSGEGGDYNSKDPRLERRIRNKDRPSLEIYRPGMKRFTTQRNSPQKELSASTSSSSTPSPSPTPPLMTSNTFKSIAETNDTEKCTKKELGAPTEPSVKE